MRYDYYEYEKSRYLKELLKDSILLCIDAKKIYNSEMKKQEKFDKKIEKLLQDRVDHLHNVVTKKKS